METAEKASDKAEFTDAESGLIVILMPCPPQFGCQKTNALRIGDLGQHLGHRLRHPKLRRVLRGISLT